MTDIICHSKKNEKLFVKTQSSTENLHRILKTLDILNFSTLYALHEGCRVLK